LCGAGLKPAPGLARRPVPYSEKRVITVERRGLAEEMWSQAAGEPNGGNAHYGRRLRPHAKTPWQLLPRRTQECVRHICQSANVRLFLRWPLVATRRPDPLLQEIDTRPRGQASNCACLRRHLLESRMREIRTSGSTRGGAMLNPPPTLPARMVSLTRRDFVSEPRPGAVLRAKTESRDRS
jgi:hypothetical protein